MANGTEMPNAANVVGDTVAHVANHAERVDMWNGDQQAAQADAYAALGGAAISAIGSIARAKAKSNYMEVYNNIREALEHHKDKTSTDNKDLMHTLGIINGQKGPNGKKYKFTLDQLSKAIIQSARSGAYCGNGATAACPDCMDNQGKLLTTNNFRAAVIDKLIHPNPSKTAAVSDATKDSSKTGSQDPQTAAPPAVPAGPDPGTH